MNAGCGSTYSVYDFIKELEDLVGKTIKYEKGKKSEFCGRYPEIFDRKIPLKAHVLVEEVDKTAIADISFAKSFLGCSPKVSMKKGLEDCLIYANGKLKHD